MQSPPPADDAAGGALEGAEAASSDDGGGAAECGAGDEADAAAHAGDGAASPDVGDAASPDGGDDEPSVVGEACGDVLLRERALADAAGMADSGPFKDFDAAFKRAEACLQRCESSAHSGGREAQMQPRYAERAATIKVRLTTDEALANRHAPPAEEDSSGARKRQRVFRAEMPAALVATWPDATKRAALIPGDPEPRWALLPLYGLKAAPAQGHALFTLRLLLDGANVSPPDDEDALVVSTRHSASLYTAHDWNLKLRAAASQAVYACVDGRKRLYYDARGLAAHAAQSGGSDQALGATNGFADASMNGGVDAAVPTNGFVDAAEPTNGFADASMNGGVDAAVPTNCGVYVAASAKGFDADASSGGVHVAARETSADGGAFGGGAGGAHEDVAVSLEDALFEFEDVEALSECHDFLATFGDAPWRSLPLSQLKRTLVSRGAAQAWHAWKLHEALLSRLICAEDAKSALVKVCAGRKLHRADLVDPQAALKRFNEETRIEDGRLERRRIEERLVEAVPLKKRGRPKKVDPAVVAPPAADESPGAFEDSPAKKKSWRGKPPKADSPPSARPRLRDHNDEARPACGGGGGAHAGCGLDSNGDAPLGRTLRTRLRPGNEHGDRRKQAPVAAAALDELWSEHGPYVGAWITRSAVGRGGVGLSVGRVVGYLAADESEFFDDLGAAAALWRILYEFGDLAGDVEDLEEAELLESAPVWSRPIAADVRRSAASLRALAEAGCDGAFWKVGELDALSQRTWPRLLGACVFRFLATSALDGAAPSPRRLLALEGVDALRLTQGDYGSLDPNVRLALLRISMDAACDTAEIRSRAAQALGQVAYSDELKLASEDEFEDESIAADIAEDARMNALEEALLEDDDSFSSAARRRRRRQDRRRKPRPVADEEDEEHSPRFRKASKKKFDAEMHLPMAVVDAFIKADEAVTLLQINPKTGKSQRRYEKYKTAATCSAFLKLGGFKDDLKNDLLKGHCDLLKGPWRNDDRVVAAVEQARAAAADGAAAGGDDAVADDVGASKAPPPRSNGGRAKRCGNCAGCCTSECGACKYCLDKPARGGQGTMRRPCVLRRCVLPSRDDAADDADAAGADAAAAPAAEVSSRARRCGNCASCNASECGECKYCKDKLSRGGAGTMRRPCVLRKCVSSSKDCGEAVSPLVDGEATDDAPFARTPPVEEAGKAPEEPGKGRAQRCGACPGCKAEECGTCKYCLDKPSRGGAGTMRRPCISRRCVAAVPRRAGAGGQRKAPPKDNVSPSAVSPSASKSAVNPAGQVRAGPTEECPPTEEPIM
ncbi:hypothetical protein M885DRAFT_505182 [Pelagophyceae sp. CCMP2097]|nr:hypothetical protein M885DRAFT_505182 [Pelagophyceae sp. CCMP2097]